MKSGKVIQRIMNGYRYTYSQCCEMPLDLLIFLHTCVKEWGEDHAKR